VVSGCSWCVCGGEGGGLLCFKSHEKNNTEQASTYTVSADYSESLNRVVYSSYCAGPDGVGENSVTRSFLTCTLRKILFWAIKSRIMRWAGHVAVGGLEEVYTGVW
jgi:hypothetical protein